MKEEEGVIKNSDSSLFSTLQSIFLSIYLQCIFFYNIAKKDYENYNFIFFKHPKSWTFPEKVEEMLKLHKQNLSILGHRSLFPQTF